MYKTFIITNPIPSTNKSPLISLNKFVTVLEGAFQSITVLGGNIEEIEKHEGVTYHSFKCNRSGGKLKRIYSFAIMEFLLAFKILTSIHKDDQVFFWIADKMILPFWAVKLKKGKLYYFLMGNVGKEGRKSFFGSASEKMIVYMAAHADYVCIESPSVMKFWNLSVNPERIKVIHLFVVNSIKPHYEKKENTIGMICRLTEGKHVLESIEAFSMFIRNGAAWKLQIIGSGKLKEECETLIRELNLEKNIELLGWVDHREMNRLITKWKLLIFPTDAEGLPNGLIEAMLSGVPAVASPVGGIPDIIEDGINGWILPDCSAFSIYQSMDRALFSIKYNSIAEAAARTIAERFSLEASINNLKTQLGRTGL